MKTKWTNTDDKRAEAMGWLLSKGDRKIKRLVSDFESNNRFKTDKEALEYVLQLVRLLESNDRDFSTCRKAMLICAGGGK